MTKRKEGSGENPKRKRIPKTEGQMPAVASPADARVEQGIVDRVLFPNKPDQDVTNPGTLVTNPAIDIQTLGGVPGEIEQPQTGDQTLADILQHSARDAQAVDSGPRKTDPRLASIKKETDLVDTGIRIIALKRERARLMIELNAANEAATRLRIEIASAPIGSAAGILATRMVEHTAAARRLAAQIQSLTTEIETLNNSLNQ